MENVPLNAIENPIYRRFSKHSDPIGIQLARESIFQLKALVEEDISADLKAAKLGAIMHDGWTENRMHFLGLLATYMKERKITKGRKEIIEMIAKCALLSISPMTKPSESTEHDANDREAVETTEFSAKVHYDHIKAVFNAYGVKVEEWAVCQIADNCSTNRALAKLLWLPHVGCLKKRALAKLL